MNDVIEFEDNENENDIEMDEMEESEQVNESSNESEQADEITNESEQEDIVIESESEQETITETDKEDNDNDQSDDNDDDVAQAELQGTVNTTANISTIICCYNCSARIDTSKPRSSYGWNSCEKCPNWCCAKCSRKFFDSNRYFCTRCADKLDTTVARTLLRTRQKVYVEKMRVQYNVKHKG